MFKVMELFNILLSAPNWAEKVQAFAAIAGVLGIALLILTYKAQLDALKEQQKITKIEHVRFKENIKPIYELTLLDVINYSEDQTFFASCTLVITNKNALGSNVKLSPTVRTLSEGEWKFPNASGGEISFPKISATMVDATFYARFQSTQPPRTLSLYIESEDELKNRYTQLFVVQFHSNGHDIRPSLPVPTIDL